MTSAHQQGRQGAHFSDGASRRRSEAGTNRPRTNQQGRTAASNGVHSGRTGQTRPVSAADHRQGARRSAGGAQQLNPYRTHERQSTGSVRTSSRQSSNRQAVSSTGAVRPAASRQRYAGASERRDQPTGAYQRSANGASAQRRAHNVPTVEGSERRQYGREVRYVKMQPTSRAQAPQQARRSSASSYNGSRHAAQVPPKRHHGGVIALVVLLALVVVAGGAYVFRSRLGLDSFFENVLKQPVEAGQDVTITIPEGSSGSTIAQQLADTGVVSDTASFLRAVQKQNAEQSLKPGTYHFLTGSDADAVVSQLVEGPNSTENQLQIAEGLTVSKTADAVESSLGISRDDFLAQAKASNYVGDYTFLQDAQDDSLEGFLYGKTYDFSGKEQTPDSVIRMMLDQYASEVSSLDFTTAEAAIQERYGVTMSDYDIVIMASIIEKEALTDDDRANIASVFYNRMAAGMALQSDATMGYVTGGEVTAEDLQTDSPYNTYLYKGLPPTPICSPSLASIEAALEPAQTNYYYFWITDTDHTFSETYAQHQQAIANAANSTGASTTGNGSISTEG